MYLEELLPRLQHRVQRECAIDTIDASHLEELLDRARYAYSTYDPAIRFFDFGLAEDGETVEVTKDDQPAQVISTVLVAIRDYAPSFPLGQGRGAPPQGGDNLEQRAWAAFEGGAMPEGGVFEMPSILFSEARYRDYYYREVSYYRNQHQFLIIRPRGLNGSLTGVIVYGAVRDWDELPRHHERLYLDYALAEFIDDLLVGEQAGLVRIPTPHGSFEFDGGRVLLALRDRLMERFEGQLQSRLSHLSQG